MKACINLSLILSAILSFTPAARAQTAPVEVLDLGSCWIQNLDEDGKSIGYKIASFGAGVAFGLYTDEFTAAAPEQQLKTLIQTQLKTRFPTMPALKYEVSIHCYSNGHIVSIQVDRPNAQPVCLNGRVKSGQALNNLEDLKMRPDAAYHEGAICYGIEEAVLGASLKTGVAAEVNEMQKLVIADPKLAAIVDKIEFKSFFAMIHLKAEYAYREAEAKKALEANSDFMAQAGNLWFNSMNVIAGGDKTLFQGKTDAY